MTIEEAREKIEAALAVLPGDWKLDKCEDVESQEPAMNKEHVVEVHVSRDSILAGPGERLRAMTQILYRHFEPGYSCSTDTIIRSIIVPAWHYTYSSLIAKKFGVDVMDLDTELELTFGRALKG